MGVFLIATGIALTILPTTTTGQEGEEKDISIGSLSECAHGLKGEVFVKNEREIIIDNFHYDGTGPAAWFHAMKRGTTGGVYTSDDSYYITLPWPEANCDRVKGHVFQGETIPLTLPVSIKELETIGMLCYGFCHNFGYVNVPHDLHVPAAPADLTVTKPCPRPEHTACTAKGGAHPTKEGGPNCGAVGEGPSGPLLPGGSTESPSLGGTGGSTISGASEEGGCVRFGNLLLGLLFLVIDEAHRK